MITGISGHLGQAVVNHLLRDNPFTRIIGVDHRPPNILGPVHYIEANLLELDLGDIFVINEISAVIHCASAPDNSPVASDAQLAAVVIEAAQSAGLKRLVVPSRDWVYRHADEPCPEDSALRRLFSADTARARARKKIAERLGWMAIEAKLQTERVLVEALAADRALDIVIPRFCAVIGRGCDPRLDAVLSSRFLFWTPDTRTRFQLLHIDDAARFLVACATRDGLRGAYNIAGDDAISLETIAGILERRLLRLPTWAVRWLVTALYRIGVLDFGFGDLVRLQSGVPMATHKMVTALGSPRLTSRQSLALWRVEKRSGRPYVDGVYRGL